VQTSFTLSKGSTRAILDVKDVDDSALIYGVDDSVGALFLAKKQMAKFLVFPEFTDPRPGYRSKLEIASVSSLNHANAACAVSAAINS
jgi:hypothetical protein